MKKFIHIIFVLAIVLTFAVTASAADITMSNMTDLINALKNTEAGDVITYTGNLVLSGTNSVKKDVTLNVNGSLTVAGVLNNDGVINVSDSYTSSGTLNNNGSIIINKSFTYSGAINNNGEILVTGKITGAGKVNFNPLNTPLPKPPAFLVGIEVTTLPDKMTYFVGDTLDLTGMVVTATYSDGSTKEVTGWTSSPGQGGKLNYAQLVTVQVRYAEDGIVVNYWGLRVNVLENTVGPYGVKIVILVNGAETEIVGDDSVVISAGLIESLLDDGAGEFEMTVTTSEFPEFDEMMYFQVEDGIGITTNDGYPFVGYTCFGSYDIRSEYLYVWDGLELTVFMAFEKIECGCV